MNLKPHQVKFAKSYKDKALLCHETGSGKTICACVWLHDGRDNDALVICPLRVVDKWRATLATWGTKATVISKDQFKKLPIKKWSGIVCDEADEFASPLFTKGRSKRSEVFYNLIKAYDVPTLLLSATPIRSRPENLHSLLCFLRIYIDFKIWRKEFFTLEHRPYMTRMAYFPVADWRTKIRPYLEKYADIVLLKDIVDDLPPVSETIHLTPSSPFKATEIEPKARFVAEHRHEQEGKIDKILEIGRGYRKILIVAYYVEQIKTLEKQLSKDRLTYAVYGGVKNSEAILKEANEVDEVFLICQASLGSGFDLDSFSCVIFVSMSYAVRDFVQMKGRVRRIHNLHHVAYHYLLGGKADKAVLKNVQMGEDFIPSEYNATT